MTEPTITIRASFGTIPMASTPSWSTITPDCLDFYIKRGRQHFLDRIESGEAIITVDNSDGNYWPDNNSGAYYPNILPRKRINIRATYGGSIYDIYTGFIEDFVPGWKLTGGKIPTMETRCADLQKNLARFHPPQTYSQETSGTRVANILNDYGWPNVSLDGGQTTIKASGTISNAMDHFFDVQQTELGIIFQAGDGVVHFQDRHHRLKNKIASMGTFGDDTGEFKYIEPKFNYGDDYLFNDVRITRSGGSEQVSTDASSSAEYGPSNLSRSGLLMLTDTEAKDQADYLKSRYKDPVLRVQSLTIHPKRDPDNLYPQVLGREISDRITLRLNEASVSSDYHIEGITHRYKALTQDWQTTWQLSDADSQQYWAIGETNFSEIGETTKVAY